MVIQLTTRVINYKIHFFRYLASGCSFNDLHISSRIGTSKAIKIVREIYLSIWYIMHSECISKSTKERWEMTALEFGRLANFPHCLGDVDEKHFRVIKPEHSGSIFYNYKDFFSVELMAVEDTNNRFVYVDIDRYGKDRVSSILNDLLYRYQFRQLCWNYPVRDLFQEQKVHMYHTSLYEMRELR